MKHAILSLAVLLLAPGAALHAAETTAAPGKIDRETLDVVELRCEGRKKPLCVIEGRPRLSWILLSNRRGTMQSAYQVLVASAAELLAKDQGDLWDSGKVVSDRSIQVAYAGKPLASRARCFWKVRVWDNGGQVSAWSPAASWEMAITDAAEWRAKWIALPDSVWPPPPIADNEVAVGQWLWCQEMNRIYIRKTFQLGDVEQISKAQIRIEADNHFDLWVNGQMLAVAPQTDWRKTPALDIRPFLKAGENIVCIRALNTDTPLWFMSALRAGMRVDYAAGADGTAARSQAILSDATWLITRITWPKIYLPGVLPGAAGFSEEAWLKPGFTDLEKPDICQVMHPRLTRRSWDARREFSLASKPVSARLYVTAHGLYEMHLNGRKVGNDLLTPDYTKECRLYQIYDVTDTVVDGRNCLAARVGSGQANGNSTSVLLSNKPLLLAQLQLIYADGHSETITTDRAWKTQPSPLLEDSLAYGERYDARLEQAGWDQAGFGDSKWTAAEIVAVTAPPLFPQQHEPVRVTVERPPVAVNEPVPGVHVYDFGQNAAGRIRLHIRGAQPGQQIVIRYGENLNPDGTVANGPYDNVIYPNDSRERFMMRNIDTYICRGGNDEIYEPRFAYTGFRYAQVSGYPGKPAADALIQRVFHNDTPVVGTFECANPLLNRIWSNTMWSWRGNIHGTPTDCPTREKNPWTDVGVQVAATACWFMDSDHFLGNWVENGPRMGDTVGWKDMDITLPWQLYTVYENTTLLARHYDKMKALVKERTRAAGSDGLFTGAKFEWGDHVAIEKTDKEIFSAEFYYHDMDLLARTAQVVGRQADAAHYAELLPKIRTAINVRFFDAGKNSYRNGTQTAQLLALAFGIVPDDRRAAVAQSLVDDVTRHTNHLTTGMTGTKFLLPVLTREGHLETAYRLATQTTYPSWGYWIERGATTMHETWNAVAEKGKDQGGVSYNHPNFGSVGEWFFECLAGIQPDEDRPGFKHFIIRPFVPADLAWAGAEYRSAHGLIRSRWEKRGDTLALDITVPANTTATVWLPTGDATAARESGQPLDQSGGVKVLRTENGATVCEVAAGSYEFVMKNTTDKETP
jgi:alpha-L-rhamnosidase